jgi:hypothetical protein
LRPVFPIDDADRPASGIGGSRGEIRTMRQGLTIVPAGLVLAVTLLGACGGPGAPPANWIAVTDGRFGRPIAPIYLLLRPDVQLDLQLKRRQVAGAEDQFARLAERLLTVKSKSGQAAMTERRAIDEAMEAWLHHELSEAQRERLTQISLQWEGASAMRRPSVVEYLRLVEPQRLKIEHLLADRDRRHAAGVLSPAEFGTMSREALAVLTPLQKQQWDGLLGPPCRFSVRHPAGPPRGPAADPGLKGQPRPAGR